MVCERKDLEANASENSGIARAETAFARYTHTRSSQFRLADTSLIASIQQKLWKAGTAYIYMELEYYNERDFKN